MSSNDDMSGRGPWPEPDERDDRASGAEALAEWHEERSPTGSRGVALAVAGLNVVVLVALSTLIVAAVYAFITVYAIVKAVSGGSDSADATIVLLGVVGVVATFSVALGVAGWAIGRAFDPEKRRR